MKRHCHLRLLLLCLIAAISTKATGFKMDMFPMNYLDGRAYTVAENLPAYMMVRVWALTQHDKKLVQGKTPVLTLELPSYLKLEGARLNVQHFVPWKTLTAKQLPPNKEAPDCNRWEIPFFFSNNWVNHLGVGAPNTANQFMLYIRATKGSAGKQGTIRAKVAFETHETPPQAYPVKILPPVAKISHPARHFEFVFSGIPGQESNFHAVVKPYTDYITMLSAKGADMGGRNWKNPYTTSKLHTDSLIGCGKQFPYLMSPESFKPLILGWQNMVSTGKVPPLIGPNGKKHSDPRATPAWYLVDDPQGHYEKYLRKGCRMFKKYYPAIRRFYWDYEPGVDGLDYTGRLRFAWKKNLKAVPSIQECTTGKFRQQWFDYMVQVHREHLEKIRGIFKEELPKAEFWMCTDNLRASAGRNGISYWCAVDNIHADSVVDGHLPMIYYAGIAFYDDLKFNLKHLKKPVLPICDPLDTAKRFFLNYTPQKIKQNMVAAAALGAEGFGFWPISPFTGDYFHAIRNAMSLVSQAEDFYKNGKNVEDVLTLQFKNTIQKAFPYGNEGKLKTVTFPKYSAQLRYTIHEKDGEFLLSVFNYHDTLPMFLAPSFIKPNQKDYFLSELDGVNYGRFIPEQTVFEVPPMDVKVLKLGKLNPGPVTADAEGIRNRLNDSLKRALGNLDFKTIAKDGASASWRIPRGGKQPMLMLKNPADEQILLDAFSNAGQMVYWYDAVDQLPMGNLLLLDQSRIAGPYPYVLSDIKVDKGAASATFSYVFKTPDAGEFPYQDLTLTQTYTISKPEQCTFTCTATNPSQIPMTLGLRLKNFIFKSYDKITFDQQVLTQGKSVKSHLFLQPNQATTFLPHLARQSWSGAPITIQSPQRTIALEAKDFAGFYMWNGTVKHGFTIEPITQEFTLQPGEAKTFTMTLHWKHR